MTTQSTRKTPRRSLFNWSLDIGTILAIVIACFAGISAYARTEASINYIEQQNLPPRVQALEAQTTNLKDGLHDIHDVLIQIRNSLDTKADKKN